MASLAVRRLVARQAATIGSRRGFSALVAPTQEFPGIPPVINTPAKASSASVTALPNGLTVVTEDASSTSTVTLTFPKAGSADEAISEKGAALVNKSLAFKSGSDLSSALITRIFEANGAEIFATAGRKGATVGFTAAPEKAADLIALLALNCSFEKWDVRDAKKFAGIDVEDANASAQVVLTEQLFAAAYGAQSPMGRPYYFADASTEAIKSFRSKAYGLNGAVLAATGVPDHVALVAAAEISLSEAAPGSADKAAPATYIGGESRLVTSSGFAQVAIGFEGPTGSLALLSVLKHCLSLMGGDGVSAFATSGLVGVNAVAPSAGASGIVDNLTAAVTAKPTADIIKRAKSLAKAEALFSLDSGSKALASAMTASVLETGTFSAAGTAEAFDAVTDKEVTSALTAMLKSNPSMASVGDISAVPYQGSVASRFS